MKLSYDLLKSLYRTMVLIRQCEESLIEPILQGAIKCPCHLYTGEEAIAAGVCAALKKTDYVFSTHRSHGHYLAKGGSLAALVAEVYGKKTGCSKGRGGSMHLIDTPNGMLGSAPIVAGTISLALGAALASTVMKENRIVVSFFGDGASGEGVLYESLNFAALKKLPIIFVCENNLYSTHMPIGECRPKNPIFEIGKPFGIVSRRIDGNDIIKVYEAAKTAVGQCRKGEGPVFLEFSTYRLHGHVGPNDNIQGTSTDIRPKEEIRRWRKKDPVKRFSRFLLKTGIFRQDDLRNIDELVRREVAAAHAFAIRSPYPEKGELTDHVFK